MGFEIPIDSDYFDHPKTLNLISILGPGADVYPIRLWAWCAKYAKDGEIAGGWRQVERACRWDGRPRRLSRALVKAGFLEVGEQIVHDWMEGVGRAIAIYERKKAKQREDYRKKSGILPEELRKNSPYPRYDKIRQDKIDNPPPSVSHDSSTLEVARAWHANNNKIMSVEKAANYIQQYKDLGMNMEAAHSRAMSPDHKGMPWAVFQPICPQKGPLTETMAEYRKRRKTTGNNLKQLTDQEIKSQIEDVF